MKVQSLNPDVMMAHLELYMKIMFGRRGVARIQREMIATLVSTINDCKYCQLHHGEALRRLSKTEELVDQIVTNYKKAEVSAQDLTMLHFAAKLTEDPSGMQRKDVELLRQHGFSDKDILDITLVVSYFNFVNRIALGLGVPYSKDEVRGYRVS
jgi:uncharacterized peroxidase-related enzyme